MPRSADTNPCFTPYDEKPTLRNRADVARSLVRHYPMLLKRDSIGGQVMLRILVDDRGAVRRNMVQRSSNLPALDSAAQRVASDMLFTPARQHGKPVWVWIQLPVVFCVKCP